MLGQLFGAPSGLGGTEVLLLKRSCDAGSHMRMWSSIGVGSGSGPFGGGSLVERNLNRWTIGFGVAFAVNTIILLKVA